MSANPAYDQIVQGYSGAMSVSGSAETGPMRAGFPVSDTVGGLTAAFAISAALFQRARTGEGHVIDVSMLDSTLVVFLTEFGRTPTINARGGRDHWGAAGSIFFTGGGTRAGQVIGATNDHAAEPTTHRYSPADVAATIYSALGIDHHAMVHDILDRPRPILDDGEPIPEIF